MTLNNFRSNGVHATPRGSYASQKLNQLHADLLSTARMWAVDDVGAAIAHQLNEPFTALLLYLHEIKEQSEHYAGGAVPKSMHDMAERAIHEMERVRTIMERLGHSLEASVDAEAAIARGRESIDSLTHTNNTNGNGHAWTATPQASHPVLTPREHEVLALITAGVANKEGGHRLGISQRTFEIHRAHIMRKLGARNAADLVRMALSDLR
jgi:DNA-binding NarL/FixJ family response regulator